MTDRNAIVRLLVETFREVIEVASDHTLEILRDDFADNGDLLPAVPRQ